MIDKNVTWHQTTWGELVSLEYGKALRSYGEVGTVQVFGTNGPIGWTDKQLATGPSVVVGRKGAYRGIHFAPNNFWVIDTAFYLKQNTVFDMKWAYYQLLTQDINGLDSGSAIPSTTREAFYRLPVSVPPFEEQKRIASILGAFDDKIELNRRMAATLEEMARAIFHSWFVDFEPVRAKVTAKAEGRDPERAAMAALSGKSEADIDTLPTETLAFLAATAALFPNEIIVVEGGALPEGWRFGALTEACQVTMGQSPPGETYNEEGDGLPFYQGRADFQSRFPRRRVYCTAATRFANGGDTLMSVRAPVGDLNMSSERCAIGRGVAAFRHRTGSIAYTYSLLNAYGQLFESFDSEGTVFGSVSKKDLDRLYVLEPPTDLIKAYEELVGGMNTKLLKLHRESMSLASLRDVLLPKLLSGELRNSPREKELAHA